MKMKSTSPALFAFLMLLAACQPKPNHRFGPYLGEQLPDTTVQLFAPEVIATGLMERDVAITSDGKEIYYGLSMPAITTIMVTRLTDTGWSEPAVAPFATDQRFFYFEPCLSPDNNTIYFLTTRPSHGKAIKPRWGNQNIWAANRMPDGSWSEPYDLDSVINGNDFQFYPSMTNNNTLYFTRTDAKTDQNFICRSKMTAGKFTPPEKLPEIINKEGINPYNAYIARNESFLIFCSNGLPCPINPGYANYFIAFRDSLDQWSEPVAFGPELNMKGSNAMSASLSPDGKYLFFAAKRNNLTHFKEGKLNTLTDIVRYSQSPENDNYDIYWVDAVIIKKLKK